MKPFDEELVSGSIMRSVGKLSWPLVLLNRVNGVHGLIDHVLVGRYVQSPDSAVNAAIGAGRRVCGSVFRRGTRTGIKVEVRA